ncbi:unnamed protein product, partial [Brassica rapa subsp. narinosa]
IKDTKYRLRREESGSSATSSKYGGVKQIESITLSKLNSYDLNSPLNDETQCLDHTNEHLMLFQLLKEVQPAQNKSLRRQIQS